LARPDHESGQGGEEGSTGGVPGAPGSRTAPHPNLQATAEMLQRAIGKGAGSMDYLKDVDDGDSTALNSKRWKHAPFFNRVKRAVANEWHPEMVYVRHDPSGNVYGVKDRVTVLRVHLSPDGKLAAWTVLQSSGVDFLDDEAIDAFRKAQPFPNPPKDLIESDGQVHFNFAFIFELSGHTSFKVFKYQ
jgi:TonB family protein